MQRGEAAESLRLLRDADRVAVAQGYPHVRPLIAELKRAASVVPGMAASRVLPAVPNGARVVSSDPAKPRPEPAAVPKPAHPNLRTLGLIWAGVFAAGFAVALVATAISDDPQTDEAAGAGVLAGVAGFALTFVYVVVSLLLQPRRRHPSWWVVSALFVGGTIAQIAGAAVGVAEAPLVVGAWVLVGVYVLGSLAVARD